MTTTITLPAEVLQSIASAIRLAAPHKVPKEATHFTESVIIYPSTDHAGAMEFVATDGFRTHTVQAYNTTWDDANDKSDRIVVGARWFFDGVGAAPEGSMVTIGSTKLPGTKQGEEWETVDMVTNDGTVLTAGQKFNLGGRWPDVRSLIHHDEIVYGDNGVGLHPQYFADAVDAAMEWWEETEDPSESFPFVIRELAPNKVCSFSLVNSHGRLVLAIMPKVLDSDDY